MRWVVNGSAEKILLQFYEKAVTNVWCHSRVSSLYKSEERCIGLPRIVLSSIVASGALCLEYVKNNDTKSYALLGLAFIGGVNSLIGSIALYLDRGKLSGAHNQVAQAWNSLAGKIVICLSKPIVHRPACDNFIESIQSDFSRLTESSPDIPSGVVKAFKTEQKVWIAEDHNVAYYLNGCHPLVPYHGEEDEGSIASNSPERGSITRLELPTEAHQLPRETVTRQQI